MRADRHLWLDVARTKLCEEGAADADFLLAPRGAELTEEQVAQYHLVDADGHIQQEAAEAPVAEEVEPAKKRRRAESPASDEG